MTAPVVHGYPDWGKYAAAADKAYFTSQHNVVGTQDILAATFVGDVPALYIDFTANVKAFNVQAVFYSDVTLATSVGAHTFDVDELGQFDIVLPVLGPYVQFTMNASAVGGIYILKVASCIGQRSGLGKTSGVNVLISQLATAVAAGATSTILTLIPKPGPAILVVDTSLTTWLATLSMRDYTGALVRIDTISDAHVKAPRMLELPARPLTFTFKNNTAAGGSYTAALSGRMAWPGS